MENVHKKEIKELKLTIDPFEETKQEVEKQKCILNQRLKLIENLIGQTNEEKFMIEEDFNGHLFQRAELILQREELDLLRERSINEELNIYLKSSLNTQDGI